MTPHDRAKAVTLTVFVVLVAAVWILMFKRLTADGVNRFVRVGYSDLRDGRMGVNVIRDNETGQCRAFVTAIEESGFGATTNRSVAMTDTWPVPCSHLDAPAPPIPPASAIK